MKIKIFEKGFNYSQDGQGNRLVYHLQGCNMRCPWCSNPEGMSSSSSVCTEYDVDILVDEVLRSAAMFFDGGGVTLTGGEATVHFNEVNAFLTKLKNAKIHTALETNGTHNRLQELSPLVDELIVDLKHYDNAAHKEYTGFENTTIISNIKKLSSSRDQLLIRITLINGFNANEFDIDSFITLLLSFNNPKLTVELLPYHEYGKDKWAMYGMQYKFTNGHVSHERLNEFSDRFKEKGINVVKT